MSNTGKKLDGLWEVCNKKLNKIMNPIIIIIINLLSTTEFDVSPGHLFQNNLDWYRQAPNYNIYVMTCALLCI